MHVADPTGEYLVGGILDSDNALRRCSIRERYLASPPAAALGWPPPLEVPPRAPIPSRDDAPIFAPVRVDGMPNTAALTEETSAARATPDHVTRGEDLRHGARSARAIVPG